MIFSFQQHIPTKNFQILLLTPQPNAPSSLKENNANFNHIIIHYVSTSYLQFR